MTASAGLWPLLEAGAERSGRAEALVSEGRSTCWDELQGHVLSLAQGLAERGLGRGDRVAILDWNTPAFFEAYYAAAALGAVLCPLNVRLTAAELAEILRDAGAELLLAGAGFSELVRATLADAPGVRQVGWIGEGPELDGRSSFSVEEAAAGGATCAPVQARDDELAQLYYTSGTTGRPKGVMLTHGNVRVHAEWAIEELRLDRDDVWAHVAPMFHLADAWAVFAVTAAGGRQVFVPRFDEALVLEAFERERVTLTNLVPTMLARLVRRREEDPELARRDLSSLRLMLSGGAPIAPALVRRTTEVLGCEYAQTYGMTETSPYLTISLPREPLTGLSEEQRLRLRAKTGRPFHGVELRVVDEAGREVPADGASVGEILARGPTVTPGYWRRPEATAEAFADGWLRTGDLANVDALGYLDIVDRKKDVVVTGGEQVYSTEVEHALAELPEVLEAAVLGLPDEEWGERVHAVVVLREGAAPGQAELIEACRGRLASFKLPRSVSFVAALPRTGSGKVRKDELRRGLAGS